MRFFTAATLRPALTEMLARAGGLLRDVPPAFERGRRSVRARSWLLWRAVRARAARWRAALAERTAAVPPEALWLASGLIVGAAVAVPGSRRFLPMAPWAPRRVALTFDDGPHPAYTHRLLDILRQGGAHATFFVVGSQAERYPALLSDVLRRGCELGNHTYDHPPLTRLSRDGLLDELNRAQRLLYDAGARGVRFFRPPGGRFNAKVLSTARAAGYEMVLWTVLPRDHEAPPPEVIRRRVLADVQDGGVILLHSGVESTAEALPGLLAELRARGFRCVSVGELLSGRPPPDVVDSWYNARALPKRPLLPPEELLDGAPDA